MNKGAQLRKDYSLKNRSSYTGASCFNTSKLDGNKRIYAHVHDLD